MGVVVGPVTKAVLRERALNGEITHDTLITRSGTDQWMTADRVKGLLSPATAEEMALLVGNSVAVPTDTPVQRKALTSRQITLYGGLAWTLVAAGLVIAFARSHQSDPQRSSNVMIEATQPSALPTVNSEADRRNEHHRVIMDALKNNTDSRKVQESLDKIDRDHGVDPNRRYR